MERPAAIVSLENILAVRRVHLAHNALLGSTLTGKPPFVQCVLPESMERLDRLRIASNALWANMVSVGTQTNVTRVPLEHTVTQRAVVPASTVLSVHTVTRLA